MPRIAIVGRGRLGSGLARDLGDHAVLVAARRPTASGLASPVWLLAVPDPRVAELAAKLAPHRRGRAGRVVLHASASLPTSALEVLARCGAKTGVMHPLVSFASATETPHLAGTTFVLGGAREAVAAGRRIALELGARPVARALHGPRYHALAALVANGSAAIAGLVERELAAMGMTRREAREAVGGLLGTVAENVHDLGLPRALTGPVSRGDAAAVRAQRRALGKTPAGRAYDALVPLMVAEARAAGLDPALADAVERALRART